MTLRIRLPQQVPTWSIRFAWYDLWVGVFLDAADHILYICPLPMLLIKVQLWTKHCGHRLGMTECRFNRQKHQHVVKSPWCAYAFCQEDACCPSGTRFAKETGGFPQDHPEECAQ